MVMIETCHGTSKNYLSTLKYDLIDHIVEYLKICGTHTVLEDSPLEIYNLHINL